MAEGYLKKMAESGYNVSSISYFHKVMIPYLLERYQIGKHEIIVDLGTGQGHCLIPLYEKGWKNLIAVDIDDYNFELFKEKYGIKCYKVDLETESIPVETLRIIIHTTTKVCLDYLEYYDFKEVQVKSWGTKWGLGKLKAYRWFKWTAFLGRDLIAIARK